MIDIVSLGSSPTVVSAELIDRLKSWAGNEIDLLMLQPSMHVGDQVEITNGPLQGFSGIILKETHENIRVTILLSFLQSGAQLNVDRADLRLIA